MFDNTISLVLQLQIIKTLSFLWKIKEKISTQVNDFRHN